MSSLLSGKVCVVTGAASGNGRAIARRCAEHGADVVVADIRRTPREGGEPTDELIESETARSARFVDCDVTDRTDIEAAVDAAERFGGIDVMVNNAAIIRPEPFLDSTPETYRELMDVNLRSVYFGCRAAIERMVDAGGGSIVNLSSTSGLVGSRTSAAYSASKGGVRLLTYSLAAQFGPDGIRVNAVHPGTIRTAMTTDDLGTVGDGEAKVSDIPLERVGSPEEVADGVVFLASDLASYVTAESLVIDGGRTNTA